jgi:hypothetical protein
VAAFTGIMPIVSGIPAEGFVHLAKMFRHAFGAVTVAESLGWERDVNGHCWLGGTSSLRFAKAQLQRSEPDGQSEPDGHQRPTSNIQHPTSNRAR